jgi:hypothetical protein
MRTLFANAMDPLSQPIKMALVDADGLESVGYSDATRTLYIKFRDGTTLRFEKVPRFRYQGLMAAPRKDAYHKTFIKDQFLTNPG